MEKIVHSSVVVYPITRISVNYLSEGSLSDQTVATGLETLLFYSYFIIIFWRPAQDDPERD